MVRPHVLQKSWDQAKKATGLTQFHLHDLRHSGNTWAAATGASTKEVMARMGHANANAEAAIRYHATADRDQAIAAALSSLVPSPEPVGSAANGPPRPKEDPEDPREMGNQTTTPRAQYLHDPRDIT